MNILETEKLYELSDLFTQWTNWVVGVGTVNFLTFAHWYIYTFFLQILINNRLIWFYAFAIFTVRHYELWPKAYEDTDFVNLFLKTKYALLKITEVTVLWSDTVNALRSKSKHKNKH